ncbi:MAG: hypothetical protein MHM6MM_005499 [Cercozoa sp. M6MM]
MQAESLTASELVNRADAGQLTPRTVHAAKSVGVTLGELKKPRDAQLREHFETPVSPKVAKEANALKRELVLREHEAIVNEVLEARDVLVRQNWRPFDENEFRNEVKQTLLRREGTRLQKQHAVAAAQMERKLRAEVEQLKKKNAIEARRRRYMAWEASHRRELKNRRMRQQAREEEKLILQKLHEEEEHERDTVLRKHLAQVQARQLAREKEQAHQRHEVEQKAIRKRFEKQEEFRRRREQKAEIKEKQNREKRRKLRQEMREKLMLAEQHKAEVKQQETHKLRRCFHRHHRNMQRLQQQQEEQLQEQRRQQEIRERRIRENQQRIEEQRRREAEKRHRLHRLTRTRADNNAASIIRRRREKERKREELLRQAAEKREEETKLEAERQRLRQEAMQRKLKRAARAAEFRRQQVHQQARQKALRVDIMRETKERVVKQRRKNADEAELARHAAQEALNVLRHVTSLKELRSNMRDLPLGIAQDRETPMNNKKKRTLAKASSANDILTSGRTYNG